MQTRGDNLGAQYQESQERTAGLRSRAAYRQLGSPTRRSRSPESNANDLSDPNTLIAVSLGANRSKGDRDPADWLPPNRAFQCTYVRRWVEVKRRWGLSADTAQKRTIAAVLASCRTSAPLPLTFTPPVVHPTAGATMRIPPLVPIRRATVGQGCDCPFDVTSDLKLCGKRSAWSKPGGRAPACYMGEGKR